MPLGNGIKCVVEAIQHCGYLHGREILADGCETDDVTENHSDNLLEASIQVRFSVARMTSITMACFAYLMTLRLHPLSCVESICNERKQIQQLMTEFAHEEALKTN